MLARARSARLISKAVRAQSQASLQHPVYGDAPFGQQHLQAMIPKEPPQTESVKKTESYYNGFSAWYHLQFPDWNEVIESQSSGLHQVISNLPQLSNHERPRLLDCACGIGTQILGLAPKGYDVVGTDLSPDAIRRARSEATARGLLDIGLGVADFCVLKENLEEQNLPTEYDVVIAADNCVAHVMDDESLEMAICSMRSVLRPGGYLVLTARPYDDILSAPQLIRAQEPRSFVQEGKRHIWFQVWDWNEENTVYRLNTFVMRANSPAIPTDVYGGNCDALGEWKTNCWTTHYRALSRADLSKVLRRAGFAVMGDWEKFVDDVAEHSIDFGTKTNMIDKNQSCVWLESDVTGYFQPVIVARNPGSA